MYLMILVFMEQKSFERLKPDMLIVLGDVSAKGSELTDSKWLSVLQQFQRIMGPFLGLPLHIVLGDRDVGECCKLNAKSVDRIASSLPGLDSGGCGVFEISNVSFVSLNAVALLCGNNDLRFSMEKFIERESLDLRNHVKDTKEGLNEPNEWEDDFSNFHWRENSVSSGSGPVLLLHFPLHRTISSNCDGNDTPSRNLGRFHNKKSRSFANRYLDSLTWCFLFVCITMFIGICSALFYTFILLIFRSSCHIKKIKNGLHETIIIWDGRPVWITWFLYCDQSNHSQSLPSPMSMNRRHEMNMVGSQHIYLY